VKINKVLLLLFIVANILLYYEYKEFNKYTNLLSKVENIKKSEKCVFDYKGHEIKLLSPMCDFLNQVEKEIEFKIKNTQKLNQIILISDIIIIVFIIINFIKGVKMNKKKLLIRLTIVFSIIYLLFGIAEFLFYGNNRRFIEVILIPIIFILGNIWAVLNSKE